MKYIGVKLIEAEPMTRGEYNGLKGWTIPADENPADEGYVVRYPDGYVSWCPKEQFDKAHLPLTNHEGSKIEQDDVTNFIHAYEITTLGEKTTLMHVTLNNGYEIVESSSCVDVKNYDMEIGKNICAERIESKVCGLLGFLLQCAKGGMR